MNAIHYIGLNVHKKTISLLHQNGGRPNCERGYARRRAYCVRSWAGSLPATHGMVLWRQRSSVPGSTTPQAVCGASGHGPSGENEGDYCGQEEKRFDRCPNHRRPGALRLILPGCYVFSPELRDLRRLMRYRHMIVQQAVRMHTKTAGLLMESGVSFHKTKLHGKKYFADLIKSLEEVPESVKDLLRMSRATREMFESVEKQLVRRLLSDAALKQRVERLSSIDGVGPITALTWALEVATHIVLLLSPTP